MKRTIHIRNAAWVAAWDEDEKSHRYLRYADVVFAGKTIAFVGKGYDGKADEVIVVSDSSKLGHSALAQLCPLETVDRLITDDGITDEWREIVAAAEIELIVVEG